MTKWERLRKHYADRVEVCKQRGKTETSAYQHAVSVLNVMEYLDVCEENGELEGVQPH